MMITETLAQIDAPHFHAGIVLWDNKVIEAAPIVRYMKGWSRDRVRSYCGDKKWKVSVVYEMQRSIPDKRVSADRRRHQGYLNNAMPPARRRSS